MKTHAQTVIVGAGIVGVSAAYYLAKGGATDILVIDRGPLFQTGGSTSHAPGGVFQNNPSRSVSKLAQQTVAMFEELSADGEPVWFSTGSLEIATTEARWRDLHRKYGYARSWDLNAALLSPAETVERFPLIDPGTILGSIFIERDGMIRAVPAVTRLAKRAEALGVTFIGETEVLAFHHRDGHVHQIETSRGVITTERALLCGGIWGPELGRRAGISIPLQPCAHPLVRTTPLPELTGLEGIVYPITRHQDFSMYLWQDGERAGVGSYRHEPVLVDARDIDRSGPAPAELDFDESVFAPGRAEAARIMPALRPAGDTDRVFGMFSFTPDGHSLIGESRQVRGLWVCEAVWVTHGIGAGKAVAELMLTGDSEIDLREADLNRFPAHAHAPSFVRERGRIQYKEVYDIIHPRAEFDAPRGLRRSPSHEQQKALGAVFTDVNGWERALWYESSAALPLPEIGRERDAWAAHRWSPVAGAEHLALRRNAGVVDLASFNRIDVRGPGAFDFLGRLSCTDLDREPGRAIYTLFLNGRGGIEIEGMVLRLAEDHVQLVTGAASGPRDLARLERAACGRNDLTLRDATSGWTAIGVWGPKAADIVTAIADDPDVLQSSASYEIVSVVVGGAPVLAVRMSYVGEDGWELHTATEHGAALWDAVWQAGESRGLAAVGLHAVDSLRLEVGYLGLGTDLRGDRTPDESGVGFAVSSRRSDFAGAAALRAHKPASRLVLIAFNDPATTVLGREPVLHDGNVVGFVTSANTGYSVEKSLALAYVPVELGGIGQELAVEYFGRPQTGRVVKHPPIRPRRIGRT